MKKFVCLFIMLLMTVAFVNARVCDGNSCRVSMGGLRCINCSGYYVQLNLGMAAYPDIGFSGSVAFGNKFASGMTFGVILSGEYTSAPKATAGMVSTYDFCFLRKYTDKFYPVVGLEIGLGGQKSKTMNNWDGCVYFGYKAGFFIVFMPGLIDVGLQYCGNYNIVVDGTSSGNYLNHSAFLTTRFYF